MAYVEQWSTDPASNTKPPPLGAAEGALPLDRVSDTFRVVMAGEAELLEMLVDLDDRIDAVIAAPAGSADNAAKFGGRTRQQFYDDFWPVGSERAWGSLSPVGLTPVGLSATWALVAKDSFLVGGSSDAGAAYGTARATVGSSAVATTDTQAAHTHSVTVGSTALTEAQIGSHLDATPVLEPASGTTRRLVRVVPEDPATVPFGSATGHNHTATSGSAGGHAHAVELPRRYVVAWFRRTA